MIAGPPFCRRSVCIIVAPCPVIPSATSVQPNALSFQLGLHSYNIEFIESTILLHRNRHCHTSTLACHGAAHHVACRGMTDPVTPGNATRTN